MTQQNKQNLGYLGEDFQYKLIHAFMEDRDFFKELNSIVDQNMFTNPYLKVFVGVMKEYYEREEAVPSYIMMGIALNEKAHNDIEREVYQTVLNKIRDTESDGVEYIRTLATKFFKQQNIVRTANEILKIAGNGDTSQYEKCVDLLNDAINKGNKENSGNSVFDDIGETLSDDYRTPIPTGIGKIDEALEGGLGKGELGVIIGSSSFGKAQPLTSNILTPNGWKAMGDMEVDDYVMGPDGHSHKVVGVYPQGIRSIYKIVFSNGSSCECDIEHLWTVIDEGVTKTLTLREMLSKGLGDEEHYKYSLPTNNILDFDRELTVNEDLYSYGLNITDTINDDYIFNTIKCRIELIKGIIDKFGHVDTNKNCVISVPNAHLAQKVQTIMASLGCVTTISSNDEGHIVTAVLTSETIRDAIFDNKEDKPTVKTAPNVYMVSAEYVRDDNAQCIMVDSEEHLYITDGLIVTHNTSLTTAMAAHAATYKCDQNDNKGYKVLQIIFEDRIKQIQRKHIGRITGIEAKDLSKEDNLENVQKILESYEDYDILDSNLKIVKFQSGEQTALSIYRYIKKQINNGFHPDLVIIDYFECLAHIGGPNSTNEYEKEGKTMRKLEAMAGELNFALWVPTQGTKDSVNLELVTMDKAGGSFKKIQIAHIVMSIARTMEDIDANKATIALLKNRAGKSGKVFNNVEFNNGTCRISTDNVEEFDDMISYGKKTQADMQELATKVFKMAKQK